MSSGSLTAGWLSIRSTSWDARPRRAPPTGVTCQPEQCCVAAHSARPTSSTISCGAVYTCTAATLVVPLPYA